MQSIKSDTIREMRENLKKSIAENTWKYEDEMRKIEKERYERLNGSVERTPEDNRRIKELNNRLRELTGCVIETQNEIIKIMDKYQKNTNSFDNDDDYMIE